MLKLHAISLFRFVCRWLLRVAAGVVVFLLLFGGYWMRGALWNRYVTFPGQAAAWEAIRAARHPVQLEDGWTEYRGVVHSHSKWSHDSAVEFEEILAAAKAVGVQFLFMTDHCVDGAADFALQWEGAHDGVLFIRGYEMANGFLALNLPTGSRLDCTEAPDLIAREIEAAGGLLFFAHTEQERLWELPEVRGMEIYNIHTDLLDESYWDLAPDLLLNIRRYADQTLYTVFDRQSEILRLWDELNAAGDMVGIAANDAHQNVGLRLVQTAENEIQVLGTSGELIRVWRPGRISGALLGFAVPARAEARELFRFDLDPYARSLRFVNTHLLAHELTATSLAEALRAGRAFIAFDMIADASGFTYMAEAATGTAVTGDSLPWDRELRLLAASPHSCRFTLYRDGAAVHSETGLTMAWTADRPGKYRLEAELEVRGQWTPWVYTNPINVTSASAP